MSYKTFRMIQVFIGISLGAIFALSIGLGNWIIPLIAMAIAVSVELILRSKIKEVVADERTLSIAGKASRLTVQIGIIGMALAGFILLAISRDSSSTLEQIAVTLCFTTCGLLVVNVLAYTYYNRKMGGK